MTLFQLEVLWVHLHTYFQRKLCKKTYNGILVLNTYMINVDVVCAITSTYAESI